MPVNNVILVHQSSNAAIKETTGLTDLPCCIADRQRTPFGKIW